MNVWRNFLKKKEEASISASKKRFKTNVAAVKKSRWRHGTIVSNILYYKLSSGLYCLLKICTVGCSNPKTLAVQTAGWNMVRHTHTHTHFKLTNSDTFSGLVSIFILKSLWKEFSLSFQSESVLMKTEAHQNRHKHLKGISLLDIHVQLLFTLSRPLTPDSPAYDELRFIYLYSFS